MRRWLDRSAAYYYEAEPLGSHQVPWTGRDISRELRSRRWTMHGVLHTDINGRHVNLWDVRAWWYINDARGNEIARGGEPAKALERALAKVRTRKAGTSTDGGPSA